MPSLFTIGVWRRLCLTNKKDRNGDFDLFYLLSIQDSNLDWLIQSQMCYHYTNGQSSFAFFYLSKAGAKIRLFFELTKFFFDFVCYLLIYK